MKYVLRSQLQDKESQNCYSSCYLLEIIPASSSFLQRSHSQKCNSYLKNRNCPKTHASNIRNYITRELFLKYKQQQIRQCEQLESAPRRMCLNETDDLKRYTYHKCPLILSFKQYSDRRNTSDNSKNKFGKPNYVFEECTFSLSIKSKRKRLTT